MGQRGKDVSYLVGLLCVLGVCEQLLVVFCVTGGKKTVESERK
jgi:hypothetical protein